MDRFVDHPATFGLGPWHRAVDTRKFLQARFAEEQENWRAWTFRDWRLGRYLERNPRPCDPTDAAPDSCR
jgi:hypothetical protein